MYFSFCEKQWCVLLSDVRMTLDMFSFVVNTISSSEGTSEEPLITVRRCLVLCGYFDQKLCKCV